MIDECKGSRRRGGSSWEVAKERDTMSAELEGLSSSLVGACRNNGDGRHRLERSMDDVNVISSRFTTLEPQLVQVSDLMADELRQIESKEGELGERFRHRLDEYKQAQNRLDQLKEAHDEHAEMAKSLSDELECVTEELGEMKKKMDGKASSVTDATPLVEIRAAIQRLKKENRELDVRIGILDYELTRARMSEANPRAPSPISDESDDEHSSDNDA